ncbi:MAG: NADH-quinone oxidoreductase subunit N [Candidatus Micrarchaeia archaeon]
MSAVGFGLLIIASLLLMLFLSLLSLFHRNKKAAFLGNIALLAIVSISSFVSMFGISSNSLLFGIVGISAFSTFFIGLFAAALILVSMLAFDSASDYPLFSFLLSLAMLGMFFVASATNLLQILLGLEMVVLPTVAMLLSEGRSRLEAAMKLFVLSVLSVTVLAFAISLVFPYNPGLLLSAISFSNGAISYFLILAAVLFTVSLGVESAQFPFNLWVPDVYEGAPGHMAAMLSGVNKKVAFVAMMEILLVMLIVLKGTLSPLLSLLAIFTMFFGNLLAMVQSNVKRLFAYSSISQAGYIMIGIAAAVSIGAIGVRASIFQIFAHLFMIIGAFAIVSYLERFNLKSIDDYSGIVSASPSTAIVLTILMLSMAGVPPLIGFYGKFLLFSSALSANLFYLAVLGIINSFMSMYYYGKLMNAMFIKKGKAKVHITSLTLMVAYACVAVVIVFGIYPQPLINAASLASSALYSI